MPSGIPVVRLFVSSTFADLEHERRLLHEAVFPDLRETCAELGAHLHVVDLRWGVTTEASHDQRAVPICLEEVDRCREAGSRPYLLVLLGQRYGWRPPPAAVTTDLMSRLRDAMTADEAELVEAWYREDGNAVPPEHRLRPRTGRYRDEDDWRAVELALREALCGAAAAVGVGEQERWAFEASVTEQEIRRGLSPDAGDGSVLAFVRTVEGIDAGDPAATRVLDVRDGAQDVAATRAAVRLRDDVLTALGPHAHTYRSGWDPRRGRPEQAYLDRLGGDVLSHVAAAVRAGLTATERTAWQQEADLHEAFGRERRRQFVGRQDLLRQLMRRSADLRAPVLVSGEPGSGKTALLAQLALVSAPAASVVRFVGATPRSRALRTFLHDVTCSLRERRAEAVPDRPASAADAVAVFRDELDRARPTDDGLVVLDGVDQLDAAVGDVHDVDLSWLPTRLPAGVQLVVSARVGPVRDALERHLEAPAVVVPPMPVSDGARLLDAWLGALRHPRRLQPRQREEVLRSFRARGLPLQLRLATEEARHWASWTEVGEGALADDVPGLIAQLFERLESEHGPMLVRAALGGIAAARHGLSEEELLDLLSLDADVPAEVRQRYPVSPHLDGRVPPVLWVRLSSDLEPYLDERSADGAVLLGFFHAELAEAARRRYLTGEAQRSRSALLADYFAAQPVVLGDGRRPNLRTLSELPYQLTRAQRWDQLHDVLTDVRFLEAKVRWGGADAGAATGSAARRSSSGVHELEADLAFALANWPSEP